MLPWNRKLGFIILLGHRESKPEGIMLSLGVEEGGHWWRQSCAWNRWRTKMWLYTLAWEHRGPIWQIHALTWPRWRLHCVGSQRNLCVSTTVSSECLSPFIHWQAKQVIHEKQPHNVVIVVSLMATANCLTKVEQLLRTGGGSKVVNGDVKIQHQATAIQTIKKAKLSKALCLHKTHTKTCYQHNLVLYLLWSSHWL